MNEEEHKPIEDIDNAIISLMARCIKEMEEGKYTKYGIRNGKSKIRFSRMKIDVEYINNNENIAGRIICTKDGQEWVVVVGEWNKPALCVGIADKPKYIVMEEYREQEPQTTIEMGSFDKALEKYQSLLKDYNKGEQDGEQESSSAQ